MKKFTIWSLIIILSFVVCAIYLQIMNLFWQQLNQPSTAVAISTSKPLPTFTTQPTNLANQPTATPITVVEQSTNTPSATETPSVTPTLEPSATPTPLPATATATPSAIIPQAAAENTVNLRGGPGTNYPVVGSLAAGNTTMVIGRNAEGTWWLVQGETGNKPWIAGSVVTISNAEHVPIVQAPPTPVPTVTPTPAVTATPTQSPHQFEATGWYGSHNAGLTRFLGTITDLEGNPVNGAFVEAQCGSYKIISNPSGPVGWPPFWESADWSPGFYDITIDNKPVPCMWRLTVVHTEDRETVLAYLSETVEVEITPAESIIMANWRKNW